MSWHTLSTASCSPGVGIPARPVSDDARDDNVLPFAVEGLDLRGRVVRLGSALDHILASHAYPGPVSRLVGEACVLTVLLATALQIEGRLQLQTQSDGVIGMLVVDFDAPDRLRALARFDAGKLTGLQATARANAAIQRLAPASLLGQGHLAVTVEQGNELQRYQGVVALQGQGLEDTARQYFTQSAQIPTRVRLAVAEDLSGTSVKWRAGGILTQFLPPTATRRVFADLDPGDVPSGQSWAPPPEEAAWTTAEALMATVADHELVDPALSSERLLYRLFHEQGVKVFRARSVRNACRCSHERIRTMLERFTSSERHEMIGEDGLIGVTCEFCATYRAFDPASFDS
ncbi:MAG TPA: Hsp33 family molecular chaperone [Methylocella sp.]|nr:Hsp33 family molecular chaperone [Methylocella sp.]